MYVVVLFFFLVRKFAVLIFVAKNNGEHTVVPFASLFEVSSLHNLPICLTTPLISAAFVGQCSSCGASVSVERRVLIRKSTLKRRGKYLPVHSLPTGKCRKVL
jgi:hypothetical protein